MATLAQSIGLTPTNPMRNWSWAGLGCFGLALLGLLTLPIHRQLGIPWDMELAVGMTWVGVAVIVGAVFLGYGAMQGRVYEADIQNMLAGHAWVHWRLSGGEAQGFSSEELNETGKQVWQLLAIGVGFGLVLGFILLVAGQSTLLTALVAGVFSLAGIIAGAATYLSGRVRYAHPLPDNSDVYVSPIGVYAGGHYTAIKGFNLKPIGGKLRQWSPEVLEITTQSQNQYGGTATVAIPVPHGHEADAVALLQKFKETYGWAG